MRHDSHFCKKTRQRETTKWSKHRCAAIYLGRPVKCCEKYGINKHAFWHILSQCSQGRFKKTQNGQKPSYAIANVNIIVLFTSYPDFTEISDSLRKYHLIPRR